MEIEQGSLVFHITSSQLRRLFHSMLEVSPLQSVLSLRIELVQNLLRHEKLSISEVASRTGFSSQFYFSLLFKQRIGGHAHSKNQGLSPTLVSASFLLRNPNQRRRSELDTASFNDIDFLLLQHELQTRTPVVFDKICPYGGRSNPCAIRVDESHIP